MSPTFMKKYHPNHTGKFIQLMAKKGKKKMEKKLTKADDRRNVGKFRIADALRDSKAGNSNAGEDVISEHFEIIRRNPLQDWNEILYSFSSSETWLFIFKLRKRIIWEKGLFAFRLERGNKVPRLSEIHPVS